MRSKEMGISCRQVLKVIGGLMLYFAFGYSIGLVLGYVFVRIIGGGLK
jgi:hypothetical protein